MTLTEQHEAILSDLKGKLYRKDWHGVRDACVDLEIIEARQKILDKFAPREPHP